MCRRWCPPPPWRIMAEVKQKWRRRKRRGQVRKRRRGRCSFFFCGKTGKRVASSCFPSPWRPKRSRGGRRGQADSGRGGAGGAWRTAGQGGATSDISRSRWRRRSRLAASGGRSARRAAGSSAEPPLPPCSAGPPGSAPGGQRSHDQLVSGTLAELNRTTWNQNLNVSRW